MSPAHAHKTCGGSGGTAPLLLNLDSSRPLYPRGMSPRFPSNNTWCGLQSSVDLYSSNSEVSAGFRKYEAKSLALSSPFPDLSEINDQLQQHLF